MIVCRNRHELEALQSWKNHHQRIAFVPTMGALHEGHLSLVHLARAQAERVVVSIFVNPAQFAPHEDFDAYPRDLERDLAMLRQEGVDLAYTPGVADIYPDQILSPEEINPALSAHIGLESDFRPHFFSGVRSVVRILFDQVKPDIAVFGEKDFQQLMVIREMVTSENLPITIIGAPTARDTNGLALSSRNQYLAAAEKEHAIQINKILFECAKAIDDTNAQSTLKKASERLLASGFDRVDYVAERWGHILAAAWIGKTRLIDNVEISV